MADLAQAAARLVRTDRTYQPAPTRAALAEVRFGLWRNLIKGARPVNASLATMG